MNFIRTVLPVRVPTVAGRGTLMVV